MAKKTKVKTSPWVVSDGGDFDPYIAEASSAREAIAEFLKYYEVSPDDIDSDWKLMVTPYKPNFVLSPKDDVDNPLALIDVKSI